VSQSLCPFKTKSSIGRQIDCAVTCVHPGFDLLAVGPAIIAAWIVDFFDVQVEVPSPTILTFLGVDECQAAA